MTFQNREVQLKAVIKQVRARIEKTENRGALTFFDITMHPELQEFMQWGETVNAGDFDRIYPQIASLLRDSASRLYSEAHPDSYELADEVSTQFCDELNEVFQATEQDAFERIPIRSWAEMLSDAGYATIENGMVTLTPMGTEAAQRLTRGVERE